MIEDERKTEAEPIEQSNAFPGRAVQVEQVREALQQSDEKSLSLLKNTPDVILNLDRNGTILFINHAVASYTVEDTVGKTMYDFIPPEQHDKTRNAIAKVFQTGEAVNFETSIIRPDGGLLRYSTRLGPVKDGDKIVSVAQISTDITERKKVEEVVRESEARYRDIFNSATDAILILDLEDHIVDANPEACKMFGYSRDEMIGLAAHKLLHPDYRRKPEEFRNTIETKGRVHFEAVNLRKDGTPLNVAVRGTMFAHNGKKHFLVTLRDITERKRAEEAWSKVNKCFLSFSTNPDDNINKIVETAGFVLQGACALYNKEEGALLCTRAGWNIPEDLKREDTKVGRICFDVISRNRDEPFVVNNLDKTHYAKSDSNVVKYGLKTCVGCAVKTDSKAIGCLCVVYQKDKTVGSNELRILSILAKALGVEEGRKQAEEMLRQYQFMVESAHDAIFFKDLESRYIIANDKTLEAFGLSREQVIGKNDYEIMPNKEEAGKNIEDDNLVFKTGKLTEITKQMTGTDGKERWFQAIKVPQFDNEGKIIGLIGIARDITERKKAEQALQASEKKYRDLVEEMTDVIYTLDTEGNVTSINKAGKTTFGREPEEVLGKSFTKWIPQEQLPGAMAVFKRILRGEKITAETVLLDKNGKPHNVEFASTPIIKDGKVLGTRGIIRDITERKKAEEKLKQSERDKRLIMDNIAETVNFSDCDLIVKWINPRGCEVVNKTAEEIVGRHCYEIWSQRDTPCPECPVKKAIETGAIHARDMETPDGRTWFITATPVHDENGKIIGAVETTTDITERKKVEEAVQDSESKYRTLVENLPQKIFLKDKNSVYVSCNENMAKDFKIKPEEIAGKTDYDLVPKELAEKYRADDTRIMESGETKDIEERYVEQGQERIIHTVKTPVKDEQGKVIGVLGIFWDITEQKKAEEQIRRLSSAVEQSIDGIAIGDSEPKLLFVNDAFARMHGYTREEMIGMPVTKLFNKEQMDEYKKAVSQQKTQDFWEGEIGHIKKDGTAFPTYVSVTVLKNSKGKPTGTLAVTRDITESKRREKELNIYREKMARAEQLASVGTLSATLAHELTQPLTVIRLSIENALAKLETTSSAATVMKNIEDSLTEVSNITSIVERFRNYARRSTKRIAGEVDLKAVAKRTVQLLSQSARQARVTLRLEGMDELPPVYSSEKDVEQLFFALIENAVQAADGKKNRQLIIGGDVQDEHIELRFSDNCGGIAPENLDRIFEPFFTTRPAGEGTGLGLCVVQRIIVGTGGKVRVESKAGKGTTFFVTLPINRGKES